MSDSNENSEEKTSAVTDLLTEVATKIGESTPAVKDRVRDMLVEREVAKRVETLEKAVAKRRDLTKAFNKVNRADNVVEDAEGKVLMAGYTDARRKEIKKAREQLEKLEKAIEAAMTSADGGAWGKLRDLV